MDINVDYAPDENEILPLSYDDSTTYEEQVSAIPDTEIIQHGLAGRISTNKLYLLSESSGLKERSGKRKRKLDEEEDGEQELIADEDADMEDGESSVRLNAVLLKGTPISHLPTARIFAYATHFDVRPIGLEWIDDTTCVLVFSTKRQSQTAHRLLQKSPAEEPDEEGFVTAKPIPITLWPPEERINSTLGKGQGLKGIIRMRWARQDDVKQRGAKKQSQFYKKHGESAGKEVYDSDGRSSTQRGLKKRRLEETGEVGMEAKRRQLDEELDAFLAEDADDPVENQEAEIEDVGFKRKRPRTENALYARLSQPVFSADNSSITNRLVDRIGIPTSPLSKMRSDYLDDLDSVAPSKMRSDLFDDFGGTSPPSKMRSDYIESDGRTVVEPTIVKRTLPVRESSAEGLYTSDRPMHRLPRRQARQGLGGGNKRESRVQKTQQELDDELEAFLNERDVVDTL